LVINIEKEKKEISNEEFYFLRDFIYENCGIYFKLEKKYLIEDKILSRIEQLKLRNVTDYIYYLKYNENKDFEINLLYEFITINETSFFRNEPQFIVLKDEILKELLNNNKNNYGINTLKIWSAGCSSGEEPYTLSIILNDFFNNNGNYLNDKYFFEILATDINQSVLNKAKRGIYNEYSLRNTDPKIIDRCFNKISDKEFEIKEIYRKCVKFKKINLSDEASLSELNYFDIIFCRNVLIYFDLESKKKVIHKFYEKLKPGGYLFLGHSESLAGITGIFKLVLFQKALAYKKE
jgi:chemotaxis protein methyltransferase CheR